MVISNRRAGLLALAIGIAGCATMKPPHQGWIPDATSASAQVSGGMLWIEYDAAGETREETGELIAMEPKSVLIMTGTGLVTVPVDQVRHYELTYLDRVKGRVGFSGSQPKFSLRFFARFPQGLPDRSVLGLGPDSKVSGAPDSTRRANGSAADSLKRP